MDLDPSVFGLSGSARSEHASTEALLQISQDMARVLDKLMALQAPIDSIRKHGVEEFNGISLEESNKAEFCLEKLQRALDEVKCPPKQMAKCAVDECPKTFITNLGFTRFGITFIYIWPCLITFLIFGFYLVFKGETRENAEKGAL